MEELEPSEINYYLDDSDDNIEYVTRALDEQYDIIGLEKEKRIYEIDSDDDEKLHNLSDEIMKLVYRPYDEKKDKGIPYHLFDEDLKKLGWPKGTSGYPVNDKVMLAQCRVYLGLRILSDLKKDGECSLYAEL